MMLIIDLTFCGDNGDGRAYHGGSDYALSAVKFLKENFNGELALLVGRGSSPESFGLKRADFRFIYSRSIGLPPEFDSNENIFFIPLPYFYIENSLIPKKARVWATVHGLRNLEISRLMYQMLPISSPDCGAQRGRLERILRRSRAFLAGGKRYNIELNKMELYKDFLLKGHRILTVSEHSKWTLELLGISSVGREPVHVAYPLHPFYLAPAPETCEETQKKGLLVLSAERREKNFTKIIEAVKTHPNLEGVIREQGISLTGGCNQIERMKKWLPSIPIKNLGYCSASELDKEFRMSRLLIYPSVSEGFGIPPVLALRYELPVLASPTSSIAEILGDAAVYCNPFDAGEIAVRILMMLNCPDLLSSKISQGNKRYQTLKEKAFADWRNFLSSEGVLRTLPVSGGEEKF